MATEVPIKRLMRGIKAVRKVLGIKREKPRVDMLISRSVSSLGLEYTITTKAQEIFLQASKAGITVGKTPSGIVAASIYIACKLSGENKTQREIAQVVGISEVTLRNRYREILESLKFDI